MLRFDFSTIQKLFILDSWTVFLFSSHMYGSLHILLTSFFVFWLFSTTKIIFYVCLFTHFVRQDRQNRQNGNFENKQNHSIKVTKIQKKKKLRKWHEPNNRHVNVNPKFQGVKLSLTISSSYCDDEGMKSKTYFQI